MFTVVCTERQRIRILLNVVSMLDVCPFPVFLQLLDDDFVSLTALIVIVNPKFSNDDDCYVRICQLTLSLYLMTQCQLKLHHSVTSLAQTLDLIGLTQRRCMPDRTLNHLTLRLAKCKIMIYLSRIMQCLN